MEDRDYYMLLPSLARVIVSAKHQTGYLSGDYYPIWIILYHWYGLILTYDSERSALWVVEKDKRW